MHEKNSTIGNIFARIVLVIWAVGILFPLLWVVYESLKTNQEFFAGVWDLPASPQFVNYAVAWDTMGLGRSVLNTIIVVGFSLFFGLSLTTLCAYCFTRLEWKGKKLWWSVILLSLFLPGINAMVPQYILMKNLHLLGKLTGLIVLYSIGIGAFDLMLLGGFLGSIPKELEESARIDGASIFKTFRSIVVPLATPGIVTVGIFKFLGLYNDFLTPYIMLNSEKKYTIGVRMFHANQQMQYKTNWVGLFAGVVIAMIPSLIVYILFQRKVIEGATLGGVKG